MERETVEWQTPEALTGIKVSARGTVAAGLGGVIATTRKTLEEPGLFRGLRVLTQLNQKGGFDCPSCAWPDPEGHRSVAEFCENGAKAVADEATTKRIGAEFFAAHSLRQLSEHSDYWLNLQGRITEPLYLAPGANHYQPITWEAAFSKVGQALQSLEDPNKAAFYTSGRASNEAAFLYQLFARKFGTNNMPDCSNMCHDSSGIALSETLGIGKGSVLLEDIYEAELILIVGQNPGTSHPRMLSALETAKRNGARIVSINPLPEAGLTRFKNPQDFMLPWKALPTLLGKGSEMADEWMPVRLNGDVALLKGLCKTVLESDALDLDFIRTKTAGYEAFRSDLEAESWDRIVLESGIPLESIRKVGGWLSQANKIIVCWAMGLTQHKNAVANVQEIVNLILMRGAIGKPGAGVFPVRGHSNVQGDRTMGITSWPKPCFLEALEKEFHFTPPSARGLDTVHTIRAMDDGLVRVLVALGGNFLSACPDTELTARALTRCHLTVQISTKLNRSHLVTGREALILPCLGRSEVDMRAAGPQYVTMENSVGKVHSSQGVLPPASSHLLSEPAIVAGIAAATVGFSPAAPRSIDWKWLADDYSRIRRHIENCIPGFEDYNARASEGFYLPNGPRVRRFLTPSGKAHFSVHPIPEWRLAPGELLMMTVRSHDQFNTTIYGLDDRYRGISQERRVVLLNAQDMQDQGLTAGQVVDLTSEVSGELRRVRNFLLVPYPIPVGCCATYFPETNPLVALESVADRSNTPISKSVVIRLVPAL